MRRSLWIVVTALLLSVFAVPLLLMAEPAGSARREQLHQLRPDVDPEVLGIMESYQEAVELEKEVAQLYREVRAVRLSQIQGQSLKKSLEQTLLPISDRFAPDYDVLNLAAKSSEDVTGYQDELKKVMQETDAIVANAEEMLKSLLPEPVNVEIEEEDLLDNERTEEKDPSSSNAPEEEAEEQIKEAKESLDDALAEMTKAEEKLEPEKPAEELLEAQEEKPSENSEKLAEAKTRITEAKETFADENAPLAEKAEQAQNALEALADALEASIEIDQKLKDEEAFESQVHTAKAVEYLEQAKEEMTEAAQALAQAAQATAEAAAEAKADLIAQQQAMDALSKASAGLYLDLTKQMKGQDFSLTPDPVRPEDLPPPLSKYFTNISGRKVIPAGGTSAVWFNVNQWYILGPYDNSGRMNVDRVYPPESIIDLDAQYIGKGGKPLIWEYDSFAEVQVNPQGAWTEYSIFYGYTELYFEEATDAWIVVGSDDRSDLWINDMPVWQSSNKLKIWKMAEGYRKVHFKQGANKVVFRLENGWRDMGFSLLINTHNPESSVQ